jgi:hypothetical protein
MQLKKVVPRNEAKFKATKEELRREAELKERESVRGAGRVSAGDGGGV